MLIGTLKSLLVGLAYDAFRSVGSFSSGTELGVGHHRGAPVWSTRV